MPNFKFKILKDYFGHISWLCDIFDSGAIVTPAYMFLNLFSWCLLLCCPFRETCPVLYRRLKAIEVQCNDSSHSIHQSPVSDSSSSRLPELSFDRLQPSEQELCGQQRRFFGRFVARGAVVDEEYWVGIWLFLSS